LSTAALEQPRAVPARVREIHWFGYGVANMAVVCVLSFATWYLFIDPSWGVFSGTYPQPMTAWLFWTIIAFVWVAFNFELHPFTKLPQPWRWLAVAGVTGGLGALIPFAIAYGWGMVDTKNFGPHVPGGIGYLTASLIVLYSFVMFTMSAINWGHWPWAKLKLHQPWLGGAEVAALGVPTLILYFVFAIPALVSWAKPGSAIFTVNTQIGWFYSIVVASILTGAVLENWPWRLAGSPGRVTIAAIVGNVALGTGIYFALKGIAGLILGSANTAAITPAGMTIFAAEVGVCWVFWQIMWPNAFGNKPNTGKLAVDYIGRTVITLVLAVASFALYYWGLGPILHSPPSAKGATVHGSALEFMNVLIIWALWYVVAGEGWGLPKPRSSAEPHGGIEEAAEKEAVA
jgi:AAT family amino acid transporter